MTGLYNQRMDANVVVLGTDNVGKSDSSGNMEIQVFVLSTNLSVLNFGNFCKQHVSLSCPESLYTHNVVVDGRDQTLNIWDAPYSQDLSPESLTEKRVQWADGFVLVYSICDRASFNAVPRLIQTIKRNKDILGYEKIPIVIVGNKRDLHHRRTVLSEEGRLLALSADCQFYEVSAAENYHSVLVVFHGLVDRIRELRMSVKKLAGIKGIVKSMSAVFARRRTDSL
ncbi:ras-related and estrogen-regulated growth inhibitor-like protein isoform X2 [Paramisgurnus dabryanus]|uniref:ras-related and estrogen-regulated growth inhibitor-like protein isoform X2 n=1 Tax=Paramisgurnus dabryanus TaxID=90735 RepID=UPI0031F3857A